MSHIDWHEPFEQWLEVLSQSGRRQLPYRGSIAAALVVLERLKSHFDLTFEVHLTGAGGQIRGLEPRNLRKILQRHGEERDFPLKVGGRTNRGNHAVVDSLLKMLEPLKALDPTDRGPVLDAMQAQLVNGPLQAHYKVSPIGFTCDRTDTVRTCIERILAEAKIRGVESIVAQHLVGAKLVLRFREDGAVHIGNHPSSAADAPTGRLGDFQIGDSVFHVTVKPGEGVAGECVANVKAGMSAVLLVPDDQLGFARETIRRRDVESSVIVESMISFVAQNVMELGNFSHRAVRAEFAEMLKIYNERVREAESHVGVLIKIPPGLQTAPEDI